MKIKIIAGIVLLLAITTAFISMDNFQVITGPHGGRLQQAKELNIEVNTSCSDFRTFIHHPTSIMSSPGLCMRPNLNETS